MQVCGKCLHPTKHNIQTPLLHDKCSTEGCDCNSYEPLQPADIVVSFEGHFVVKREEAPEERMAYYHALVQLMENAVKQGESTEDVFDRLNLSIRLGDVVVPTLHRIRWE